MSTRRAILCFLLVLTALPAWAEFRFPMPEFSSGYEYPEMHTPPTSGAHAVLDMAVLFVALCLASWLVLKKRSRAGVFSLAVFSIAYFGFWREGCVCAVGSIQNMVAGVADSGFQVPLVVLVFFLLPLVFSLFLGRVFCAAVCPLGAVQEAVAIRPVQVPRGLEHVLGLLPYLYLGLTVLSVSTGAGFLICQYDPYVGFFRMGASFNMFLIGGIFLVAGIFIGRPYCRYLCPYGVLLGWASRFSKWHAKVTPSHCIQCHLCAGACPYNAIETPTPETNPEPRQQGVRRLGWLLAAMPLVVAGGALAGYLSHEFMARLHPTVRLAERVAAEERGEAEGMTIESEAFRGNRQTIPELYAAAHAVRDQFRWGTALLGAFMGLVVSVKLIGLSVLRPRRDYETNRTHCVSCARCFAYCPVEEETHA